MRKIKIIAVIVIVAMITTTSVPSVFAWYREPGEYKTTTRSEIGGNVLARDLAIVGVAAVLVWYFGKHFMERSQNQSKNASPAAYRPNNAAYSSGSISTSPAVYKVDAQKTIGTSSGIEVVQSSNEIPQKPQKIKIYFQDPRTGKLIPAWIVPE